MSRVMQMLLSKPWWVHDPVANYKPSWMQKGEISTSSHSLRIATLLVVIVILNAIDLVYTLYAHYQGELSELNPIAANLLDLGMVQGVICYKAASLLIGGSLLWRVRYSPWAAKGCWVLITVYTLLAIQWIFWMHSYTESMRLQASFSLPFANLTQAIPAGF